MHAPLAGVVSFLSGPITLVLSLLTMVLFATWLAIRVASAISEAAEEDATSFDEDWFTPSSPEEIADALGVSVRLFADDPSSYESAGRE